MSRIWNWIKNNKLAALLLVLIIGYFLKNTLFGPRYYSQPSVMMPDTYGTQSSAVSESALGFRIPSLPGSQSLSASKMESSNRIVVSNSSLSLMVENVASVQKQIISKTKELGGYMVDSNLSNPQDAASATVTVRFPSPKLNEALDYFRGLSIKVVSENLQGEDVTDQYVDNKARLETLNTTKTKFEEILSKATSVQDILEVQREIINLQAQIDQVKGQQQYLEQNASMTKVTIYLSTDELSLPYTPDHSWRPAVVFKEAVRSLLATFQKLGNGIIWLVVYAPIWIPVILIIYFYNRRKNNK